MESTPNNTNLCISYKGIDGIGDSNHVLNDLEDEAIYEHEVGFYIYCRIFSWFELKYCCKSTTIAF